MQIDLQRHEAAAKTLPPVKSFIGETKVEGSGEMFHHVNPSTGLVQARFALAARDEVDLAVKAARQAYDTSWSRMRTSDRSRLLFRLAELVDENIDEFGLIAAMENGTPVASFKSGCVDAVSQWMHYYAGWADKLDGIATVGRSSDEHQLYSLPEAYGVIGHIITWNGPLPSLAMKVPASLAAGNTVVLKPSEFTPFTALRFAELALEAGIPPGVINVVPGGAEAGETLVLHPDVPKLSFTGGLRTAQRIAVAAAPLMKPLVLELGGKSANLFFADGDIEALSTYCALVPMFFSGQGCALPTRLLVEEAAYPKVIEHVSRALSHVVVGDPLDDRTGMGPVVNHAAVTRILSMIDTAVASGAGKLAVGGRKIEGDGAFVEPTLLTDVDNESEIAQHEVFGPVLCMMPFADEAEAVRLANATEFGLAAWAQTRDTGRAQRLIEQLEAGSVFINPGPGPIGSPRIPFGGNKMSGTGREGGRAGIDEFIRYKGVGISRF